MLVIKNSRKTYELEDFVKDFPTEKSALEYLKKQKYKGKFILYKTKTGATYVNKEGKLFNPTKGTVFFKMGIPMHKVFYAVFLLHYSPFWSVRKFADQIGIGVWTAFRLLKKLRPQINRRMTFINNLNLMIEGTKGYLKSHKST